MGKEVVGTSQQAGLDCRYWATRVASAIRPANQTFSSQSTARSFQIGNQAENSLDFPL